VNIPPLAPKAVPYLGAAVAGFLLGWGIYHPRSAPVETYAPPVVQKDSSLVVERKPDANAKPGMIVPKGGTVERLIHLSVRPQPETTVVHDTVLTVSGTKGAVSESSSTYGADSGKKVTITCPPLKIDLALVRLPDNTRRVVAKATGGKILAAVDIPVESAAPERPLAWSAGPIFDVANRSWGAAVTRELGPIRLLGAMSAQRLGGVTYLLGAAIKF
jgi:hypothetical protein